MNLPWAQILAGSDVLQAGDFSAVRSVFWDDGWCAVAAEQVGSTVSAANAVDMDGAERVYVRPTLLTAADQMGRSDYAIAQIRQLGRVLPGVGLTTPSEAARLAYLSAERCVRRAFGLPDVSAGVAGLKAWPGR